MVRSFSTNIEIRCYIVHFAWNTSVYEQTSTYDCSISSHDISLSEILCQRIYRTWGTHIDLICSNFLVVFVPTCSHCSDRHQCLFSFFNWPLCWLNKSGNMCCSTHIPVLWAFQNPYAIGMLTIGSVIYFPLVNSLDWIMQVAIEV